MDKEQQVIDLSKKVLDLVEDYLTPVVCAALCRVLSICIVSQGSNRDAALRDICKALEIYVDLMSKDEEVNDVRG